MGLNLDSGNRTPWRAARGWTPLTRDPRGTPAGQAGEAGSDPRASKNPHRSSQILEQIQILG
jgi:hypothetical protein